MSSKTPEELETFINDYLREDLKDLEKLLNECTAEAMEYIQLKNTVESIKENFRDGMKTQVNVGANFFIQANVPKTDSICVHIGKDIYMDFTLEEALQFLTFKIKVLTKRADIIREESVKKRAEIKLGLLCIAEKRKLVEL